MVRGSEIKKPEGGNQRALETNTNSKYTIMADQKTHWKTYHNPDYIGAYAFQPGERKILTITQAKQEQVIGASGKKEECLVVHFKQDEKPLICNVTNSKAIAKVSDSPYIEDWRGVNVELYTTEVQAFGEAMEAVRIKQTAPKIEKPALTKSHTAYEKVVSAVADGYSREQVEEKYTVTDAVWKAIESGEV